MREPAHILLFALVSRNRELCLGTVFGVTRMVAASVMLLVWVVMKPACLSGSRDHCRQQCQDDHPSNILCQHTDTPFNLCYLDHSPELRRRQGILAWQIFEDGANVNRSQIS